ncbi:PQQ-binding-like beta-propeller repeat protein [Oceanirhabdus sp. W0125-5]|uniref:PQQ-binding-like beta-propeller repeat protein n=1 Tax=Oceanirhabdus sp. W0125-5 TaxID=2999116 RepID=UPI0022F2FADB|nr:PQQ-binding-like beta-propeller repeat protein [Oceanirhabdus sp. W0125-5]WBW97402.1 pyrrolo-quinoline quinone [Oceanirhabdus sp. W0125-5]
MKKFSQLFILISSIIYIYFSSTYSCFAQEENMNIYQSPDYSSNKKIKFELFYENKELDYYSNFDKDIFTYDYSKIPGVLTFRGDNYRSSSSYGTIKENPKTLSIMNRFTTSYLTWGGGAGWTGQPLIVQWPNSTLKHMNVYKEFKESPDFIEVICVSLDGHIYFFDLFSGKPSRDPINIENPIKGTPSIDSRGYPLLYVGQGLSETGKIGYRIYSLIDNSLLLFINGRDKLAFRGWGAFDSSPLLDRKNDTLLLCGENGLFYNIKLNTNYNSQEGTISISPEIIKLRYSSNNIKRQGIESSPATYKNYLYFADNSGTIVCLDLRTLNPIWVNNNLDDTDATITIDVEDDVPYLYCANEVDHQGEYGNVYIRKYNGFNGFLTLQKTIPAYSILGNNPINGGALSTNIIGKKNLSDTVIFSIARYKTMNGGLLIALDKNTFEEKWRIESPYYSWSSPVAVYTKDGEGYIINCDSIGNVQLIDGKTGKIIDTINLEGNIESSPAVFNNTIVVPSRNGNIYFLKIESENPKIKWTINSGQWTTFF